MPTRELNKDEMREAREAGRLLKEECAHCTLSGECLQFHEMCFYDNQKECSNYESNYKSSRLNKKQNDR